MMHISFIS